MTLFSTDWTLECYGNKREEKHSEEKKIQESQVTLWNLHFHWTRQRNTLTNMSSPMFILCNIYISSCEKIHLQKCTN